MDILFVTRWTPDECGGGTQQRAAANLRALATCGRVHLLNLGADSGALTPRLAALVASVTALSDVERRVGRYLSYGARTSWTDRLLHTAWGMSGLIAQVSQEEVSAIADTLPHRQFDGVFAFHLGSALVADRLPVRRPGAQRVIDWDFLESPNVLAWARAKHPELGWRQTATALFNRAKVRRWELHVLRHWEGHLCSSPRDIGFLRARANRDNAVSAVSNSVHVDLECPPPPSGRPPTVLFAGTLAYWPNLDAVQHFLLRIWPTVRRLLPTAELKVVGRAAPASLMAESGRDGVTVHTDVASVTPYYAESHVAIVPLRFAVGSNLKVPEAMAHGRPVVGYREACERHGLSAGQGVFFVDDHAQFSKTLVSLLSDFAKATDLGVLAHRLAKDRFSSQVVDTDLARVMREMFSIQSDEQNLQALG